LSAEFNITKRSYCEKLIVGNLNDCFFWTSGFRRVTLFLVSFSSKARGMPIFDK